MMRNSEFKKAKHDQDKSKRNHFLSDFSEIAATTWGNLKPKAMSYRYE